MSSFDSIFASVSGQESGADYIPPVIAPEEAEAAVIEAELSNVEKEVAQQEVVIQQAETAIDAIEDKIDDLQEQIEGMESMMNGTTPYNAALFADKYARMAKIVARFHVPISHVGAESLSEVTDANLNAYAGLCSAKETAGKALGKVKEFFISLYNSFIAAITGLFNRLNGIKKSAENLKKTVQGKEKIKEGKVKIPTAAALYLDKNGNAGNGITALVSGLNVVPQHLDQLNGGKSINAVASVVDLVADKMMKFGSVATKEKTADTATFVVSVDGNKVATVVAPITDKGIPSTKWTTGTDAKNLTTELDVSVSKSDLVQLCVAVAEGAGKLQTARLDSKSLNSSRDKAIAALDKGDSEAEKEAHGESKAAIKAGHRAVLALGKAAIGLGGDILVAQLGFIKAHI